MPLRGALRGAGLRGTERCTTPSADVDDDDAFFLGLRGLVGERTC